MGSDLDKALAELGRNIENRKTPTEQFDYGDYRVRITLERDTKNITLEKDGMRSNSAIKEDGAIGHTELFDVDDKLIVDERISAERKRVALEIILDKNSLSQAAE